jgi:uncharacterized membrane protein HdeD (DUF308 family)
MVANADWNVVPLAHRRMSCQLPWENPLGETLRLGMQPSCLERRLLYAPQRRNAGKERSDELHPTTTRTTDAGWQLVDAAHEGDSRCTLRAGGALLAGADPLRVHRLLRAYALIDGILAIVAGIRGSEGRRWLLLAEGVLGVLAGLIAFFWPGMTALVFLYVISAWAIFTGLLKVVMAISFRRELENEWLMILSGVLSVVFGVILGVLPGVGLLSLVWLLGIYALIFGVALIVLGFRVRGHRQANGSRVS